MLQRSTIRALSEAKMHDADERVTGETIKLPRYRRPDFDNRTASTQEMSMKTRTPPRNVSVDMLRTVSILLVLVLHTMQYVYIPGLMRPNAGYYGVTLFFVISGYLITSGAIRRYGAALAIPPLGFYRFRAARIVPGLLLFTLLNVVFYFDAVPGFELVKTGPTALPELLFYVFTFQSNVYAIQGGLPHAWFVLWSLAIEEMFYLLFPVVCFVITSRRWLIAFLCLIVVLGPISRLWVYPSGIYSYFGCFDQLALGCLTALAVSTFKPSRILARVLQFAGVIGCTAAYFLIEPTDVMGPSAMALGGALFLAGSRGDVSSSPIARVLTLPGQWSYEIYLFHMPILKLLYANGIYAFFVVRCGIGATFILTFITIFAISGAIAVWLLAPFSSRIRGRSMPSPGVRPVSTARDDGPDLLVVGGRNSRSASV
jgi:peptidoglycan/LPS O-acetylase OafA/YrhL